MTLAVSSSSLVFKSHACRPTFFSLYYLRSSLSLG